MYPNLSVKEKGGNKGKKVSWCKGKGFHFILFQSMVLLLSTYAHIYTDIRTTNKHINTFKVFGKSQIHCSLLISGTRKRGRGAFLVKRDRIFRPFFGLPYAYLGLREESILFHLIRNFIRHSTLLSARSIKLKLYR